MKNSEKTHIEIAVGYFFSLFVIFILVLVIFMIFNRNISLFHNEYFSFYEYADGINNGTEVTLNGIKVGEVKSLDIEANHRVKVIFTVDKKFSGMVTKDSVAKIVRPLMIGNKQINIIPGKKGTLPAGSEVKSEDSSEFIDLVSGMSLQKYIDKLGINEKSSSDSDDYVSVRDIYDRAISSLVLLNELQLTMKGLNESMNSLSYAIYAMNEPLKGMSQLSEAIVPMTESMQQVSSLSDSMYSVSEEMSGVTDSFDKMSDTLLGLSSDLKTLEPTIEKFPGLIDRLDLLLRATEKSWLLKREVDMIKKQMRKEK